MPLPTASISSVNPNNSLNDKPITVKLGQTINFSLISQAKGSATINIAGQTLNVSLNNSLPAGKLFQATVTQLTPELKLLIKPNSTVSSTASNSNHLLAQNLAKLLPNQAEIKPQIQQMIQLQSFAKLPLLIQNQLTSLIDSILKITPQINAAQIRQALGNSGLFLESKLYKKQTTSSQDFKAGLFKIKSLINSLPVQQKHTSEISQLSKSVALLINKVNIQQIQSIENQGLSFQLPIFNNQTVQNLLVDVRREKNNQNDVWEILTEIELDSGQLVVKSVLNGENLTFQIWASSPILLKNIKKSLNSFKELLNNSSITYKGIYISNDKPKVNQKSCKIALIDIKV